MTRSRFKILHDDASRLQLSIFLLRKKHSRLATYNWSSGASSWQIREAAGRWVLVNESKREVKREKVVERRGMWWKARTAVAVCLYLSLLCSTSLDTLRPKTTWRLMVTFNQAEVALCARRHLCACCSRWRGTYRLCVCVLVGVVKDGCWIWSH